MYSCYFCASSIYLRSSCSLKFEMEELEAEANGGFDFNEEELEPQEGCGSSAVSPHAPRTFYDQRNCDNSLASSVLSFAKRHNRMKASGGNRPRGFLPPAKARIQFGSKAKGIVSSCSR